MKTLSIFLVIEILTWICIGDTAPNQQLSRLRYENTYDYRHYNVGVLMASHSNYPFGIQLCGPAVDMALEEINEKFLAQHKIKLTKVQKR